MRDCQVRRHCQVHNEIQTFSQRLQSKRLETMAIRITFKILRFSICDFRFQRRVWAVLNFCLECQQYSLTS